MLVATQRDEENATQISTYIMEATDWAKLKKMTQFFVVLTAIFNHSAIDLPRRAKNFQTNDGVLYRKNVSDQEKEKLLVVQKSIVREILCTHHIDSFGRPPCYH